VSERSLKATLASTAEPYFSKLFLTPSAHSDDCATWYASTPTFLAPIFCVIHGTVRVSHPKQR